MDHLVSLRSRPFILETIKNFVQLVIDFVKEYFLCFIYDSERDAEKVAAHKLEEFFEQFLEAQLDPTDGNVSKIKKDHARLDSSIQSRLMKHLKEVIRGLNPEGDDVAHKAILEKVVKNPFFLFTNEKGDDPSVMGLAIARAIESYNVIINGV